MCRSLNSPSLLFLKMDRTSAFFQSSGTSDDCHDDRQQPHSDTTRSINLKPIDLCMSKRVKRSITLSSSTVGTTTLLQTLLEGPRMPENKLYQ